MIFANFHCVIFVNFHYFFRKKKKKDFSNFQPLVCPCDVHSRQNILWQVDISNFKLKRVRRTFILFFQRKQKNMWIL